MDSETPEKPDLSHCSEDELEAELARRRSARMVDGSFLDAENAAETHGENDAKRLFEEVVRVHEQRQSSSPVPCPLCGKPAGVKNRFKQRTVRTMAGEVSFERHRHHCGTCNHGFYPLDQKLGLPAKGELSPKMHARVLDFGLNTPFEEAAKRWPVHHPGAISDCLVRNVVERAGNVIESLSAEERQTVTRPTSMEPAPHLIVQVDGSMIPTRDREGVWKEAKMAAIYRSDKHLKGSPTQRGFVSDPRYSTSLLGIRDFADEVDAALMAEAAEQHECIAWVGDGASWVWNLQQELCPSATPILDFTHMKDHAIACGKALLGEQDDLLPLWTTSIVERVRLGRIDEVLAELSELKKQIRGKKSNAVSDLLRYYQTNRHRMNYPIYRELGLPVGSGVVESAHRHVLQVRMKLAGQHWDPQRAHRMARLRAAYKTAGPQQFQNLPLAA